MRRILLLALSLAAGATPQRAQAQEREFAPALPRDGATLTFANELIDAWNVTWRVDTPTPMHRHTMDYFGVELTGSETLLTAPDGGERTISLERGRLWFLRAGVTHAETGLTDDPPRRAIIVELKDAPPRATAPLPDLPMGPVDGATEPAIDNDRVSIWDVTIPAAAGAMRFHHRPVVLLFMETTELEWTEQGGLVEARSFGPGEVLYLAAGTARALRSRAGPSRVIVAELKD